MVFYTLSFVSRNYAGWEGCSYFKDYPTKDEIRIQFFKEFKAFLKKFNQAPEKYSILEKDNSFYLRGSLYGSVEASIQKLEIEFETQRNLKPFLTDEVACIRRFVKGILGT